MVTEMKLTDGGFRSPSDGERAILSKLLEVEFQGRPELVSQLADVLVRSMDENGSLAIRVRDGAPMAPVHWRTPVEAQVADADGITVVITLHVVGGMASELEIIRGDSRAVLTPLDPPSFT